tara:strand:+ start:197555 stop:198436 length:882 start_codon:yes stop_codon:yes gene_type:complete
MSNYTDKVIQEINSFHGLENKGAIIRPGFVQVPACAKGDSPFKLVARNEEQQYLSWALNRLSYGTVAIGAAGSGKTAYGVARALISQHVGLTKHIVVTRPMVEAEEESGILPGGEVQKIAPYLMPIFENLIEMGHGSILESLNDVRRDADLTVGAQILKQMLDPFIIATLGKMRGRTFRNSIVLLDEAQNTTKSQMKMFLSRIGVGSSFYVCGDLDQIDTKFDNENNGLRALVKMLENTNPECPLPENMATIAQFLESSNSRTPATNDEINLVKFGASESQRGEGVTRVLKYL